MNNKYRINNRQIKQVHTQKNSQVRAKMSEEFYQHGSPPGASGKGNAVRNQQSQGDPNQHHLQAMDPTLNKKQI